MPLTDEEREYVQQEAERRKQAAKLERHIMLQTDKGFFIFMGIVVGISVLMLLFLIPLLS